MTERSFSVVVCTDGRLPTLKATLQGLRALDYGNFEIVLVVGPTADGTREYCASLADIKLALCPERNLSKARNLGISLAAGEIVAFLDDDAIPEPEWLDDLNRAYDDAQVAAAGGVVHDATGLGFQARYVAVDRLGYPRDRARPTPGYPLSPDFPHMLGANCSFRRDVLLELGGFDEEYEYFLDETDLQARLNDSGGAVAQLADAVVHHRPAASALRSAAGAVRHWRPLLKNRVYFALRNGARHHSTAEILRAAADDAESWRKSLERDGSPADLSRLEQETRDGVAAALIAATRPRRLMRPAEPPPFRPLPRPDANRLCLALVTQDYPPNANGGIARNTEELARAWAKSGHYVHVFTRARAAPSLDFEAGVWVHRLAIPEAGPPPLPCPPSVWNRSRTMFEAVAALRRRVDWVYAPLWDGECVAFLTDARFKLVCALQTTMAHWLESNPDRARDAAFMRDHGEPMLALERWCLDRAPLLHANSRAIAQDLGLVSDARIVYAPHGLSDWAAEPRSPPGDEIRFLFVGRLESRKGIDTLLAAAPALLDRCPQARLDIVGDDTIPRPGGGSWRDGADARIRFHGRAGERALRAHYRACDVLVAPSRYESFGLVFVEGMMFGKPVIAGDAGGAREVVVHEETGLLVPPGDPAALVDAMIRLAESPALRRALGEAGRRRYETLYRADAAARTLLEGICAASALTPQTPH